MPMRVSAAKKTASTSRTTEAKRLPPIDVGSALSKKIDKAIVSPNSKPERQLKLTARNGFVSPSGNPLQTVYLTPAATKTGLDITYVDATAKQFWAQAPGTSGLVRGPFKLPAGADKALAAVTARELKAANGPANDRYLPRGSGGRVRGGGGSGGGRVSGGGGSGGGGYGGGGSGGGGFGWGS